MALLGILATILLCILYPKTLGDVPTLGQWPEGADVFIKQPNNGVLMDEKTAKIVWCRLNALITLPKIFKKVLDTNLEYERNILNIKLETAKQEKEIAVEKIKSSMWQTWQIAGITVITGVGAISLGFLLGHFL